MHFGLTFIETICNVFSVFYYGPTHVSADKDSQVHVYIPFNFMRYAKSVDRSRQRARTKCRTSSVENMVALLFHAAGSKACKFNGP